MPANKFCWRILCAHDVDEAFNMAVRDSQNAYGPRGHTGTVGDKSFYIVLVPKNQAVCAADAYALADVALMENGPVYDEESPAGAIAIAHPDTHEFIGWLFFGRASV